MRGLTLSVLGCAGLAAAFVAMPSAPAFAATKVSCGQVITKSITLANNLADCPGDGLDVGASGITIRLAGHTISGTNLSSYGINIGGYSNVTVKNGWVTGFVAGVYASNQDASGNVIPGDAVDDVITGVHANDDADGIFVQGTGDIVSGSQANNDDGFGIGEQNGTNTTFSHDTANGDAVGIQANGDGTSATGSTLISDCTTKNDNGDGIYLLREVSDTVSGNTASHDYTGIDADQMDSTTTVTGNQASYDHTGFYLDGSGYLGENGVAGAGGSGITVSGNTAQYDNYGFYDFNNVSGYPDTVANDTATLNYHAGIYLEGTSGATVDSNTASATKPSGDGIYVDAASGDSQLQDNTADSNGNDGIYVADTSATLTGNTADQNVNNGIVAAAGDTDGGGNSATGNGSSQCVNLSC